MARDSISWTPEFLYFATYESCSDARACEPGDGGRTSTKLEGDHPRSVVPPQCQSHHCQRRKVGSRRITNVTGPQSSNRSHRFHASDVGMADGGPNLLRRSSTFPHSRILCRWERGPQTMFKEVQRMKPLKALDVVEHASARRRRPWILS